MGFRFPETGAPEDAGETPDGGPGRRLESLELALKAGRGVAWTWDLLDDRMTFSRSAPEVYHWPPEAIPTTGAGMLGMIPDEDRVRISAAMRSAFSSGEPYDMEHRIVDPKGTVRWVSVQGQPVRDGSGRVVRVMGVSADITARKRAEDALRREKERAQVTLSAIHDGVIRTDSGGVIDFINPAAAALIGVTPEDAAGCPVDEIYRVISDVTRLPRPSLVGTCLARGVAVRAEDLCTLVARDGTEVAVRDSAAPLKDAGGRVTGVVLAFTDVSRLRILEREMSYLATHDPLTGLINRREFEKRLQEAIDRARSGGRCSALGYLDLDDFKLVNDTCGHDAGDELLRRLTSELASAVAREDTLARLGGDEFGLILCADTVEDATARCGHVLDTVRRFRFLWGDRMFEVRASIGLVGIGGSGGSMSALLSAADAACYVAKDRGRNQIHVSQPDDDELAARAGELRWVQRINEALQTGRFVIYYQQIRPLQDDAGEPIVELLLRLKGDHEVVTPGRFLSAAERYHLMPALDRWVLRTSLAAVARAGRRSGAPLFAINLSGQSLADPSFGGVLSGSIREASVDPTRLLFEITETSAISNLKTAYDIIAPLIEEGCRFVLDDFGSGLSSFRYLRNLPVSFLKIDGDLVRRATDDPPHRAMVASIHEIGLSLGLKTIGEGVESMESLETLRALGVHFAQGFHLHEPAPFDELELP